MTVETLSNVTVPTNDWIQVVSNTTGWSATVVSNECSMVIKDTKPTQGVNGIGVICTAFGYRDNVTSNVGGTLWCRALNTTALVSATTW